MAALSDEERYGKGERGAWIGVVANLLLAFVKVATGLYTGSRALLADGANNATDVVGSLAVLIGLRVARRPADADHRYGHQRAEAVAVMVVGALMAVVGIEVALEAFQAARQPRQLHGAGLAALLACASIAVKEALYRYKMRLARKTGSPALRANAWDHRSDALATGAALIGIIGAYVGFPVADPIAGLVVAGFILRAAYKVGRDGIDHLMDHFDEGRLEEFRLIAAGVDGVAAIHEIRARHMGSAVLVDLTIGVDRSLSVVQGHQVAERVEERLLGVDEVEGVMVHVEPAGRSGKRKSRLVEIVKSGQVPEHFED